MKKIKYLIFLFILLPINVKAVYFNVSDNVKENNQEFNESTVFVGSNVNINNNINGINNVLGNNINISGKSEYLISAGNYLKLNGEIKKDGIMLGNRIEISDFNSGRDLIVLGNEIIINGDVKENIHIYGNKIILNGIYKNVFIKAQQIEINGEIKDKLEYNSDAKIEISKNSKISNKLETEPIIEKINFKNKIFSFLFDLTSTLCMFLILYFIIPNLFNQIEEKNKNLTVLNMFSFFGFGALSILFVPTIILLLFGTGIGFKISLFLLIIFILSLYLSTMIFGYFLGNVICKKIKIDNQLILGLIGISLVKILSHIPIVGNIFMLVFIFIGMGLILQQLKRN